MTIEHLRFVYRITKTTDTHSCARIAQSVQRLAMGLTVRRSAGKKFTQPSRLALGPHSLLYMGIAFFSDGKVAGAWR